jgi:hypothetical protein
MVATRNVEEDVMEKRITSDKVSQVLSDLLRLHTALTAFLHP